jgi:hypothetical protein
VVNRVGLNAGRSRFGTGWPGTEANINKGRWMMATYTGAGTGAINVIEGSGASMVILIALLILFGAAAYFTGRLYGTAGMAAVIGGFFAVVIALYALGGLNFG